jgi:hypothetical protein
MRNCMDADLLHLVRDQERGRAEKSGSDPSLDSDLRGPTHLISLS